MFTVDEKFITQKEICKNLVRMAGIKEDKHMPVTAAALLESSSNKLLGLIKDPSKDDQYQKNDGSYSKSTEFKSQYPELAITDKFLSTVIYSDLALGYSLAVNLTNGINKETYENMISDLSLKMSMDNDPLNGYGPVIKFINDKAEIGEMLHLVNERGSLTNSKKPESLEKLYDSVRILNGVGEVNIAGDYRMYTIQSTVTVSAMSFIALESTYYVNLTAGLNISAILKRS